MREAEVTVGPVYDVADAAADPHFRERGIVVDVEDRDLGTLAMHNVLPRLSETPGGFRRPAPRLGEHTDAILTEAGLDRDAIASMKNEGAAQ
jgi:crotonobetainyl-CoA:carnitine CoA-transferase CaiB-like acyl-CoA transferase